MLKFLQARLQHYVNWKLPDMQSGFRKVRGTRDQSANICWITQKLVNSRKNLLLLHWLLLWLYRSQQTGKFLKTWEYQTTLCAWYVCGQEATVRTGHGTTDLFQVGKGVCQGCILSPWLSGGSDGKAASCNMGGPGSIPGSGRSPGEGNGNPLQYSCLENSMDGGAW